jgi:hypothetical protein
MISKHIFVGPEETHVHLSRASVFTDIKPRKKLRGFSPQANKPTERPPLVGEVRANFSG